MTMTCNLTCIVHCMHAMRAQVADVEQQQLQPDQQAPQPGSVCSLGLEAGSERCDTACSTNNAQRPRRRWNDSLGR